MDRNNKTNKYLTIAFFFTTVIVSFILHYPQLWKDLIGIHLWRQTQTQWNTINFYRHDFNIFNPRTATFNELGSNISRYEFPIMQWAVALVMKVFGDAIIVTRLCYFTIGCFSALGMYRILKLITANEIGSWMGAWAFTFSPLFFYYTINPLPDNCALFGAIWFLYYLLKYSKSLQFRYIYYSAIFLMIAAFAKLPYILFGASLAFVVLRNWRLKETYKIILVFAALMLPVAAWYAWVIPTWGDNGVLYGIFENFSQERYDYFLDYHKKIMFPDILLNEMSTYLFLMGVLFAILYNNYKKASFWLLCCGLLACIAYWLLELNMIDIVHDYYMMPFLPFLYIVVGYALVCLWRGNVVLKLVALVFVVSTASVTYHTTKGWWSIEKSYINPDAIIYQHDLKNAVPSDAKCFIAQDVCTFIFPYLFDKMGYDWNYDTYPAEKLRDLIENKGVKYMYCSVRTIDSTADVQPLLKRLIIQRGSFKVWELQSHR